MSESIPPIETIRNGTSDAERNEDTHRGFKPRHSQMIAIGGAIGTSLFLRTSQVLRVGGPLFLLISYRVLSIPVYCIVTGIAEVATYLPVPGGIMAYYGHKYVSSSMGFAMGYLCWYSLGILIPYEFFASTLLTNYWGTVVNGAVWITIIYVIIVIINLFPVRVFGECEFWSAGMKVLLILGLIFLSILLFFGGGPHKDALYFGYWKDPVCASNDPRLTASGTARSPFIIAIRNAGIPVLDSIVNALILLSAITAANAFLYSASRNLYSLAKAGNAPAIFKRCDRYGLPYYAVLITASLGCLAYLSLSNSSLTVFNWLINLTNTSGYISWICCSIIYARYRKAITHHKLESPYRSRLQPWGMYFGVNWLIFFTAYIGISAFLLIYFGHRLYQRGDRWVRDPEDIDMYQGMDEVLAAERPPPVRVNIYRRLWALVE
ncbi:amino acid permease/ SLC12A domain-containing protein [Fusarium redolens]|uniref:Amino acid permease/ SLC12A domain-containing protein n=1 Tax=Fusarium redolens TaxID=48865 RepID=A0A9P9GPX2_FUSRE|nr:amino acid permease/ SLC12A domain-containing protein [Fusarium redolens]KAH7243340.1 amino acid permease/ SLC12A domain-containing protein [Fusarium redolens]